MHHLVGFLYTDCFLRELEHGTHITSSNLPKYDSNLYPYRLKTTIVTFKYPHKAVKVGHLGKGNMCRYMSRFAIKLPFGSVVICTSV